MAQQWYDPSSKWMLEERGASLLWLAGARSVLSARAKKAEVVQPRQLPDGLLEASFADAKEPRLVLVEVATYPEPRAVEQISDDFRLVRQARGVLCDAVVICLCPKGTYRIPERVEDTSALGWSSEVLRWKVVELWTMPAEDLLAAPDVGVVPWATLGNFDGPPEVLLQRCRDRIDREGGGHRENLLAVSQVFARLHFDRPDWLEILGGMKAMIESPLIQEIGAEFKRTGQVNMVIGILKSRFGEVAPMIEAGLKQVSTEEALIRLGASAGACGDIRSFEADLRKELPQAPPPSTRGKRRGKKPGG
jgi:hypothetical protein